MTNVTILGIPLNLGAKNFGADVGPQTFRDQKIKDKLTSAGFTVSDAGNIACQDRENLAIGNPNLKYAEEITHVAEIAARRVEKLIKQKQKIIALGGDHSSCLGVISGASVALQGNIGLIYLDAHGDMNTIQTTRTGNIHGMPLAALMGFGDKQLVNIYKPQVKIAKENMLHIGGNDFDEGEIALIEKEHLQCFKMIDLLSYGMQPLFNLINELAKKVENIWVSLDLDCIDEIYAPGVGMPNKGGFTYREITTIAEYIGKQCHVVGIDIDEFNPLTEINGKTAELGIELSSKLLGGNYSWYTHYMEANKI